MPSQNQLILTGAQYKAILIIPGGGSYPFKTLETISWSETSEGETIYAVGEEDPIGEKSNNNKYGGKFTAQNGEMSAICAIEGIVSPIRIRNAIIAITALVGGFSKTFTGININSATVDVKRKDKETLINCDFAALSVV